MANGNFAGGDGTLENPYLIEDAFDLDAIRNDLNAHYKLIRNINLDIPPFNEGKGWEPINDFSGTLDGNMYYIYKLYINGTSANNIGLFGSMINGAIVQNLKIKNAYIENTYNRMGILVGDINKSSCKNISVSGTLHGAATVGGIAGYGRNSNILNCYSDITILLSEGSAGGILAIAQNETKVVIRNCISSGQIVGGKMVGGIVGNLSGSHSSHTIDNCYSMVDVNGKGGLIGCEHSFKPSKVRNCFWNIDISKTSTSARGIGLTDEESKSAQTFIDAGWDEEVLEDGTPVWTLKDGEYPVLWFVPFMKILIRSNSKYYTYQNNEFIEVEPTIENFKENFVDLSQLTTPNENGIKPYKLLDNPSIVTYTEDEEVPILFQTVIAQSKVRFLVSKDRTNYQVYRDNNWVFINKFNIMEQGMTKEELEAIPQEVWAEWFEYEAYKHSFNILVGMYSENPNKPLIRSITVNYAENEPPMVVNAYIEPDTIHNEFAVVRAKIKDYEGDKISFKVLIKKAGMGEFIQVSPKEGWYNRNASETEITQAFNFPYFNPGENEVKLVVKDERGAEAEWTGRVILSNTDPTITIAYDDFSMRATIGDDDNDMISYRIAINGELVFDYTDFVPSKTLVNYVFDTSKMKFGEENIITIEVKDTHGGYAKQEFAVIGSYRGLMFKNENGEYFVNSNGEVLMDLLFDKTLIAGQISETKKVILENRHEFPITNVQITPENPNFTKGAVLEISETEMPFTPKDIIKVLEVMPSLGEKDFYVRVKTTREAHQGGYFYIKSTATPVIE